MHLHIVLRTHDSKNIHGKKERYLSVSKKELVIGCVSSLIKSANAVLNHSISFTILDDHSTDEFITSLKKIFSYSKHSWKLIHLDKIGYNYSALKQFEYCKNSNSDLVYSVEDDYLHYPSAISEMLDAYVDLKNKYELEDVCIFPYDSPIEYNFDIDEKFLITRGRKRHWRSSNWTTQTFMTSPKVFQDHWVYFEKLAKKFKVVPKEELSKLIEGKSLDDIVWEDTTIGKIWKKYVNVFVPIPSLCLHVQFKQDSDPYINHFEWWDKFSKIKKFKLHYL